jgi:TonB family protein
MPEAARQAGVRGVVILEIVVAPDGSVGDVKILRSIPLLDQRRSTPCASGATSRRC